MDAALVDAYLTRIGLDDSVREQPVNAETLRMVHRAHMMAVPFENLDVRAGVPIALDARGFVEKIVRKGRGGFCYELNGAFAWLLKRLGFRVRHWSANVFSDGDWGIEFDHMLLAVDLDMRWIADVGFGDSFLEPLPLIAGSPVSEGRDAYRLDEEASYWVLTRKKPETDFAPEYRFRTVDHTLSAFAPGLSYHRSPASHFTQRTVCSVATPDGRKTLTGDRLIRTTDGGREEFSISSRLQWHDTLRAEFGIQLSDSDFSP